MQDTTNLKLSHLDACRVLSALRFIKWEYIKEINDPSTTPDRRKVCEQSRQMYERIYNEIDRQIDEQDA